MIAEVFDDGDERYLAWIAEHPNGYVLNRRRVGFSRNYLVLHTSACGMVSSYSAMVRPGGFTTRGYIKVCAAELVALREYVRTKCDRYDGSFTLRCNRCSPNAGTPNESQLLLPEVVSARSEVPKSENKAQEENPVAPKLGKTASVDVPFTEGRVEDHLLPWLEAKGYSVRKRVRVANGIIDVVAQGQTEEWIIEAKGEDKGGYNSAEMNFRIGISQICSRMEDSGRDKAFGLAIPMTTHFEKVLRKHRNFSVFDQMRIWLLIVDAEGAVTALHPAEVQKFVDDLKR